MIRVIAALALLAASPAVSAAEPPSAIKVVGEGSVKRLPDTGTASFSVRGEGATSAVAVEAMLARRKATDAALAQIVANGAEINTGELAVRPVRSKDCDDTAANLSVGDCALRGYVASLEYTVRTEPRLIGTIVSAVTRAGATSASASSFGLRDEREAQAAAIAAAVADGRRQAAAIASASGARLGRLVRLDDSRAAMYLAQETSTGEPLPPYGPPAAVLVEIELKPEPVIVSAKLVMVFEVLP